MENKSILKYVDKAIANLEKAKVIGLNGLPDDFDVDAVYKAWDRHDRGESTEYDDFIEASDLKIEAAEYIKKAIYSYWGLDENKRYPENAIDSLKKFKDTGDIKYLVKAFWELSLFDDGDAWI